MSPDALEPEIEEIRFESGIAACANFAVARMNRDGFATIDGFLSPRQLSLIQDYAASVSSATGGQTVSLKGDQLQGSLLGRLATSPEVVRFMHLISSDAAPVDETQVITPVLRCLTGKSGQAHSMHFHHDNSLVTAVLPIRLPAEPPHGDLFIIPNGRSYPVRFLERLRDKALLYNPIAQYILGKLTVLRPRAIKRIALIPGNLYTNGRRF